MLIDIKKASEMIGVSTKTLRRWDDNGKLIASRTSGGHRRYNLSDIETLLETLSDEPSIIEDNKCTKYEEAIAYIALGLCEMTENELNGTNRSISNNFLRGISIISSLTLDEESFFHNDLYSAFEKCKMNLNDWGIEILNRIYKDYSDTVLYRNGITHFCRAIAYSYNPNINEYFSSKNFNDFTKYLRKIENGEYYYTRSRSFIKNHPHISQFDRMINLREELNLNTLENSKQEKISTYIENFYIDIPPHYKIGSKSYICSYCKSIMEIVNNSPICTSKCMRRGKAVLCENDSIRMVNKHTLYSIVVPSILEDTVFQDLNKIKSDYIKKIELYPLFDICDIQITFKTGEIWSIDVKDWENSFSLANNLNKPENREKMNSFNNHRFFLVIHDEFKNSYRTRLKKLWKDSNKAFILTKSEFKKEVMSKIHSLELGDILDVHEI